MDSFSKDWTTWTCFPLKIYIASSSTWALGRSVIDSDELSLTDHLLRGAQKRCCPPCSAGHNSSSISRCCIDLHSRSKDRQCLSALDKITTLTRAHRTCREKIPLSRAPHCPQNSSYNVQIFICPSPPQLSKVAEEGRFQFSSSLNQSWGFFCFFFSPEKAACSCWKQI